MLKKTIINNTTTGIVKTNHEDKPYYRYTVNLDCSVCPCKDCSDCPCNCVPCVQHQNIQHQNVQHQNVQHENVQHQNFAIKYSDTIDFSKCQSKNSIFSVFSELYWNCGWLNIKWTFYSFIEWCREKFEIVMYYSGVFYWSLFLFFLALKIIRFIIFTQIGI